MFNLRTILFTIFAFIAAPLSAASEKDAASLVQNVSSEIITIVNSGKSQSATVKDFNKIMGQYADMQTIARSALGPASRSASKSELAAFTKAFQGYIARKYGKQFGEFTGGAIEIKGTKDRGKFIEVSAMASTPTTSGINITFRVWDRPGSLKFIDILTEGISLVTSERAEIGALLEQRNGSIAKLTRDLDGLG